MRRSDVMARGTCCLLLSLSALSLGCREERRAEGIATSQLAAACDPGVENPSVLFDGSFQRATGSPTSEARVFAAEGNGTARLCAETTKVAGATVTLNGSEVFGPNELKGDVTVTRTVTLRAASTIAVEVKGKPCKTAAECATVRIRVLGPSRPPPRIAAESAPDACCTDPTCDRQAFAARGGICRGDPRIRGPLPIHAPAANGP